MPTKNFMLNKVSMQYEVLRNRAMYPNADWMLSNPENAANLCTRLTQKDKVLIEKSANDIVEFMNKDLPAHQGSVDALKAVEEWSKLCRVKANLPVLKMQKEPGLLKTFLKFVLRK